MPEPKSPFKRVRRHFNQKDLKRVCEMNELDFAEAYGLDIEIVPDRQTDNFYLYKDNGSNILAVAHLDTVIASDKRTANFVSTQAGPVVFSGALDDRLGAYTILELMPKLGIEFDWLLTVGEESGRSTAEFFDAPKEYNWMIEFDRGGKTVVMYQYDDSELRDLVRASGARPDTGIFSDISYMEHLEIKGINWGVGYQDYHGPRGHAYLEDYWEMMGYFLKFHEANKDTYLPHDRSSSGRWGRGRGSSSYGGYGYGSLWGDDYEAWDTGVERPYQQAYQTNSKKAAATDEPSDNWWDDEDLWTDDHWDAYLAGGIEAVRALGLPEAEDPDPGLFAVEVEVGEDDEEMVSDDFRAVNRALTAGSSTEE